MAWHTLHIFAYGETQLISNEFNKKVKSTELTKLAAYVDLIKAKKPNDIDESEYRLINTFNNIRIDYSATNHDNCFTINWGDLSDADKIVLNELITEIEAYTIPEEDE